MKTFWFKLFLLLIFSISFFSCKSDLSEENSINLRSKLYWVNTTEEAEPDTIEEWKTNKNIDESESFKKFTTEGFGNIADLEGRTSNYIFLKSEFELPEDLKGKALALYISYLHYADKVWFNDSYIGGYGEFPPHERGALYDSHFYMIPEEIIKEDGVNVLYIKVYCRGRAEISDQIYIGDVETIKISSSKSDFFQSIIYLFFEGGAFYTACLFFLIYIWRKKELEYLSFSLLCLSSMIFTIPFCITKTPWYYTTTLSYLTIYKFTFCEGLCLIMFFLSFFITRYMHQNEGNIVKAVKIGIFAISSILVLVSPTYDYLMKSCQLVLVLSLIQFFIGIFYVVRGAREKENRRQFIILVTAFSPVIVTMIIDITVKIFLKKIDNTFYTIFGWQITIFMFIISMTIKYNTLSRRNEYLNIKLRHEVRKQTKELSIKNTRLSESLHRSEMDLEMASLVQKKFFPYPPKNLRGWDIAVSYNPLDQVSGDMYDFYIGKTNDLDGFSLFDVSGHGIAASLVTMLAKNIIFQSFLRNKAKNETVSRTLYEINEEIIEAKGGIENYLTGLMFRFQKFDENDDCKVLMANAGHPNPILYSAKSNICDEIESGEEHHGAIGLDFITVSFPQIEFTMGEDDVLVFYTDGLSEGRNTKKEMFGKERIKKIIKENYAKDAQSIMESLIDAYTEFTKDEKRDDDITIVVLKRENSMEYIEELLEV